MTHVMGTSFLASDTRTSTCKISSKDQSGFAPVLLVSLRRMFASVNDMRENDILPVQHSTSVHCLCPSISARQIASWPFRVQLLQKYMVSRGCLNSRTYAIALSRNLPWVPTNLPDL